MISQVLGLYCNPDAPGFWGSVLMGFALPLNPLSVLNIAVFSVVFVIQTLGETDKSQSRKQTILRWSLLWYYVYMTLFYGGLLLLTCSGNIFF